MEGDIASPSTATAIVDAAVNAFGRIDVLVSNAGICPFHTFLDLPHDLWKRVQDVNLNGAFYTVQAVANQMARQTPRGGSIVAISSISALMGGAEQAHYTPTKAGVKSLMESCAIALGGMGIRCNSVLPGEWESPNQMGVPSPQELSRPTLTDKTSPTRRSERTCRAGYRSGASASRTISLGRSCSSRPTWRGTAPGRVCWLMAAPPSPFSRVVHYILHTTNVDASTPTRPRAQSRPRPARSPRRSPARPWPCGQGSGPATPGG